MQANNFITVQEAIQKGKLHLLTIPRVIIYACIAISILHYYFEIWSVVKRQQPFAFERIAIMMGISATGILAAYIWQRFHSASWKIWALEHVKDVQRLYQIADEKGMISKRGSWLNIFEYKTATQKQRLAELESRLDAPREMDTIFNIDVPNTRAFRYSLKMLLLELAIFIFFLIMVRFMFPDAGFFPIVFFFTFFIITTAFRWLPRLRTPVPLQLDTNGILIKRLPFIPWREVRNVYLETRPQGRSSTTVLVVESTTAPKSNELDISALQDSSDEIEKAVYDFWANWRARQGHSE